MLFTADRNPGLSSTAMNVQRLHENRRSSYRMQLRSIWLVCDRDVLYGIRPIRSIFLSFSDAPITSCVSWMGDVERTSATELRPALLMGGADVQHTASTCAIGHNVNMSQQSEPRRVASSDECTFGSSVAIQSVRRHDE